MVIIIFIFFSPTSTGTVAFPRVFWSGNSVPIPQSDMTEVLFWFPFGFLLFKVFGILRKSLKLLPPDIRF